MATLGRREEIINFLDALINQTYKNYELIIIDQNEDDRVKELYAEYKDKIEIQYYRNPIKGLSVNRNIGLAHITGDITAFPDDDCVYEPDTLENASAFFRENASYAFYTCNAIDKNNNKHIFRAKKNDADISVLNFLYTGISFTIFIRSPSLQLFRFDDKLGLGTKFGSGEESDLILFLLKHKNRGRYYAGRYVYHPAKEETEEKAFSYGKGFGALHKKAIAEYSFFILFPVFIFRLLRGIIRIIIHKDKKLVASLQGRILGFLQYESK
jgi:glycosyltransferase involved in cell wall biosynthesis